MFAPGLCMTLARRRGQDAPFLYGGDLCAGIAAAKGLGYDGVELHVRAPEELDLPALQDALREAGMRAGALGTGRAYVDDGLSLIDPDTQEQALGRLKGFIDAGAALGAVVIIGCLRGNIPSPGERGRCLSLLARAMREADGYAAERGATLALEAINRYENNYLCSVYEAAAFVRETGLSRTGILADAFHMNIEERSVVSAFEDNIELIRYVHAADSNRRFPGAGHTDFFAILSALRRGNYRGDIGAECLPLPDDGTASALWLQNMKGYLARL